jgi:hypothetical protein
MFKTFNVPGISGFLKMVVRIERIGKGVVKAFDNLVDAVP